VIIPRVPPAFDMDVLSVNSPTARSTNVVVKHAKRRMKEKFFRKAAIVMRNVNMPQASK